jgi:hypothetical protein
VHPGAGALPETSALPRHFLRRSRLDFVAELGTSFEGGWRVVPAAAVFSWGWEAAAVLFNNHGS